MEIKLVAVGDLHLRKSSPLMRKDDYFETLKNKLAFILEEAQKEKASAVIFPGDVFDRFDAPYSLVEYAIRVFSSYDLTYLFVFGNHDLRYHTSDKVNTPLGVLVAGIGAEKAKVLDSIPFYISSKTGRSIALYGASWGEAVPTVVKDDSYGAILVTHWPITVEQIPWEIPNLVTANAFMQQHPDYDLFITGDNHNLFTVTNDKSGQDLINLGSVGRQTIQQLEHVPSIAKITIHMGCRPTYVVEPIPIEQDVWAEGADSHFSVQEAQVQRFVESMRKEFNPELSFVDNLQNAITTAPEGVKHIISKILSEEK